MLFFGDNARVNRMHRGLSNYASSVSADSALKWRWSWMDNGLTYGCIIIGLLALVARLRAGPPPALGG
jgi:hypothetical protein